MLSEKPSKDHKNVSIIALNIMALIDYLIDFSELYFERFLNILNAMCKSFILTRFFLEELLESKKTKR